MATKQVTFVLCIIWLSLHLSSCSIAHMKHKNMKALNWGLPLAGHKLNMTPIATTKATKHMKCMAQCTKVEGCVAINLGPSQNGEGECEMLNLTRYSKPPAGFTAKPGWTYVGPKVYIILLRLLLTVMVYFISLNTSSLFLFTSPTVTSIHVLKNLCAFHKKTRQLTAAFIPPKVKQYFLTRMILSELKSRSRVGA